MSNLIGTTIGSYNLVEEVGKGGMAIVYKAYQPNLDRWVAVKVLDPAYTTNNFEALARFRKEAKAIAGVRHPNILTIHDYGEEDGLEYIVTEYVEGGTLKDQLTGTPFDWKRAAVLAIGVGQALATAHSHGIIHRDVKPANVLLPRENWPLLADFGLAKIKEDRQSLTEPGITLGTPTYTSPEQALGEPIDQRADIYALGVLLYEMVTGRAPFASDRHFEVMLMHMSEPPPRPRDMVPEIPDKLESIILKALEKQPSDRYSQMADMVEDMETLMARVLSTKPTDGSPADEATSQATVEIDSLQSFLRGPHFTVAGSGAAVPIPRQDEVLIGRADPTSGMLIDVDLSGHGASGAGVSRQHAKLVCQDDQWTVEDLRSTNGTYINKKPVSPYQPVSLKDGDRVDLGQLILVFHIGGEAK